jgi:hypothetical protein
MMKNPAAAGFFCYTRPAYLLKLIKGSQRARKWGKWLPPASLINLLEKRKDN